jgi:heptaprenyl diphosphate synthase
LGLANVVTLILLINYRNPLYAFAVTAVRCLLAALILGAMSALLFSLAGGLVSCAAMWLLFRLKAPLSVPGVSIAGALAHNVSQLAAAALLAGDPAVFGYLPILICAGAITGFATGYAASRVTRLLNARVFM